MAEIPARIPLSVAAEDTEKIDETPDTSGGFFIPPTHRRPHPAIIVADQESAYEAAQVMAGPVLSARLLRADQDAREMVADFQSELYAPQPVEIVFDPNVPKFPTNTND